MSFSTRARIWKWCGRSLGRWCFRAFAVEMLGSCAGCCVSSLRRRLCREHFLICPRTFAWGSQWRRRFYKTGWPAWGKPLIKFKSKRRRHCDPHAKVRGQIKKCSRHNRRLKLLTQQPAQLPSISTANARKHHRPKLRPHHFQILARVEKLIQRPAIPIEQRLRTRTKLADLIKRDDTQTFTRMNRRRRKQIVQQPHSSRELGCGKDPPATQPTQPKRLRQTTRDDKLLAQMKRSSRRHFKQRLDVNLINQNTRTNTSRNLTDLLQRRIVRQHTTRIVQVRQHDQPRVRSHMTFNLLRQHRESILKLAREALQD